MTAVRRPLTLGVLGALALGGLLAGIGWGAVAIDPTRILAILLDRAGIGSGVDFTSQQHAVLWSIRLPRVLLGLIAGAALALAGTALQAVFRNPLADPALLGLSGGATTGVVLALISGVTVLGTWTQPLMAAVGALLAALWLQRFSRQQGRSDTVTLILAGVALQILLGAVVTLLIAMANKPGLRDASFWTLGSLSGTRWTDVFISAPVVLIAGILLVRLAPKLNLFLLGEAEARHLGIDTGAIRLQVLGLVSLITGTVVAYAGSIAFVGLVVPHLLRSLLGPDHRLLLPASALGGATLLLLGDAVARNLISPMELPLGVLMTIIGGPLFFYLIDRSRRAGAW